MNIELLCKFKIKKWQICFSRLNAGNVWQPALLVSITHVKVEGWNEPADMDQLQIGLYEDAANGNRLHMSVSTLRCAWPCAEPPRPRKRISEVRAHRLELNLIGLFSLLLVLCTFPPSSAFQLLPRRQLRTFYRDVCQTPQIVVKIPARISVLHLAWHRPYCHKSTVTPYQTQSSFF